MRLICLVSGGEPSVQSQSVAKTTDLFASSRRHHLFILTCACFSMVTRSEVGGTFGCWHSTSFSSGSGRERTHLPSKRNVTRREQGTRVNEYKQGFAKTSLSNKNMLDFMGIYSVRIKAKHDWEKSRLYMPYFWTKEPVCNFKWKWRGPAQAVKKPSAMQETWVQLC